MTPHVTIGEQIAEPLRAHLGLGHAAALADARGWLDRVRIPEAARRLRQYPHELSGGMRQRVMIAAAMACGPELLIADEPTTALDVTVQAEILDLMEELKRETHTAMVLITHDMGVIARLADRVAVMKDGLYVEEGAAERVFSAPESDYTRSLLDAIPRLDRADRGGRPLPDPVAPDAKIVVEAHDLKVWFPISQGLLAKKKVLRAVDGVSFRLRQGETLGVVGESGSGKSTLARAVLNLLPPSFGAVTLMGRDITHADQTVMRAARKDLQIVFQDPLASLDPRMTIGDSIAEPLRAFQANLTRAEREGQVHAMMDGVELDRGLINRYPHELSGGQNQRVGVARAMILQPRLVICDEAVSALDVSIRAQIIDLLIGLQKRFGMAMLFISHDLAVVREISHRVMVLYLGRVMEQATREQIYAHPLHPYTKGLLSAVPIHDPGAGAIARAGAAGGRAALPARPLERAPLPSIQIADRPQGSHLHAAAGRGRAGASGGGVRPGMSAPSLSETAALTRGITRLSVAVALVLTLVKALVWHASGSVALLASLAGLASMSWPRSPPISLSAMRRARPIWSTVSATARPRPSPA